MNTKRKGSRIVYKIRERLLGCGYQWVIISAASLGPFDIIAISTRDIRLIQAKANKWPGRAELDKIEKTEVPDLGRFTDAVFIKEVWCWKDYVREPDVKRFVLDSWVEVKAPLKPGGADV